MGNLRIGGVCLGAVLSAGLLGGCSVYKVCKPEPVQSTNGVAGKDFKVVALTLDESDEQAVIRVIPDPIVIHWENRPNRVLWTIPEKDPRDEWIIEWKGPDTGSGIDYFPPPPEAGEWSASGDDDAIAFTAPCPEYAPLQRPTGEKASARSTGPCVPPAPGESVEWYFRIRVLRNGEPLDTYDPPIMIRYP